MSDIVVIIKAEQILTGITKGERCRISTLKWPNSHPIPETWKKVWKQFIQNTVQNQLSQYSLGKWTAPSHQKWMSYTSHDQSFLRV